MIKVIFLYICAHNAAFLGLLSIALYLPTRLLIYLAILPILAAAGEPLRALSLIMSLFSA